MRLSEIIRAASLLILAVMLTSCGGGGSSTPVAAAPANNPPPPPPPPPPPVTSNFTATAVNINTSLPRVGYELEAVVTFEALEPEEDVWISLSVLEVGVGTAGNVFPLGVLAVPSIDAGSQSFTFSVDVPANIAAGGYSLQAYIDPADTVEESDEDDNLVELPLILDPIEGPGLPAGSKPVFLFIESAVANQQSILLDTRSYDFEATEIADTVVATGITDPVAPTGDASATMTVAAVGAAEPIEVEAFASLRFTRTDRSDEQFDVPLYLWNSEEQRYMNAYGVDPQLGNTGDVEWLPIGQIEPILIEDDGGNSITTSIDRLDTHLEFYFPGRLARTLEDALLHNPVPLSPPPPPPDLTAEDIRALQSYLFGVTSMAVEGTPDVLFSDICVKIRPVDPTFEDEFLEDNERCLPLAFELPPQPLPPPDEEPIPFEPVFPNPTNPLLFTQGWRNTWGGSELRADVGFGVTLSADERGAIAQISGDVGTTILGAVRVPLLEATARAQSIPDYSGAPAAQQPGFTINMSVLGVPLVSLNEPIVNIEGTFPEPAFTRSYSRSKTFFPGGVPVTVTATASGTTGLQYNLTAFSSRLGVRLVPLATLFVTGTGGIGVDGFQVGLGGEVLLFAARLPFNAGIDIEVLDDGFQSGIAEFLLTPSIDWAADWLLGGGSFFAFAEYFDILCLCTRQPRETIAKFKGDGKFDLLLPRRTSQIDVVVINGGPPIFRRP